MSGVGFCCGGGGSDNGGFDGCGSGLVSVVVVVI